MWRSKGNNAGSRRAVAGVVAALAAAVVGGLPGGAAGAPGDLDLGFGGASHGRVLFDLGAVTGVAVQPNGKIVAVGYDEQSLGFDAVAGRFDADGLSDDRFGVVTLPPSPTGASPTAVAQAVTVQPDGKIVVAGKVTDAGGHDNAAVWRLTASGALDKSFGPGGTGLVESGGDTTDEEASAVALDSQGRIVVAGTNTGVVGSPDLSVVRLTSSGEPDTTFNAGRSLFVPAHPGIDFARSVAVQRDGRIVVGGYYQGASGNAVVRIAPGSTTTAATLDDSFGDHGVADVPGTVATNDGDIAVTQDGHILLLDQVSAGGRVVATVVRLKRSGKVDASFGSPRGTGAHLTTGSTRTTARALVLLPHGGVVVVGSDQEARSFVAKLDDAGKPDLRMGPGGVKVLHANEGLVAVAALADGRVLLGGNGGTGNQNVAYRLRGELRPPSCGGKKATIVGTKAADTLVGTKHADVIAGLGGGDTVTGLGKGDIICGGGGRDHLSGGPGADHLYGGPGHDTLRGGPGHDVIKQ